MLIIAVPKTDISALETTGYRCRINLEAVLLRRDGDYLCYDGEGTNHRCKILTSIDEGERVQFYAASNGDEGKHHEVVVPGEGGEPSNLLHDRTDDSELASEGKRFWIAVNGASCALSITPMRNATTIPIAEQMWGFPTLEEALKAQRICLTAPMPEVMAYLQGIAPDVRTGRVVYKRPAHPEPPTCGTTVWMEEPSSPDEREIAQAVRCARVAAESGGLLPGLPGGPKLH